MRIPGVPYVQGRNDYTDGDGRKYGIAIHNTSNDATAEGEASYATRRADGISAHLYVDRDSVVQSLDTDDRAGHAGSSNGNQHAVAVEITGVNGWTRQQWLDRVAWAKLGAALAHVVRKYGIAVRRASVAEMRANPRVRAFYGHDDMRRAWGGTTHTDPGPTFPWDRLFQAVNAALDGEDDMALSEKETRNAATLGLYDGLWVAVNGKDYNGISYDGVGKSIRNNLAALTVAPILAALAGLDAVDETKLANALAPAVAAAVVASLPEDRDDVTVEELAEAIRRLIVPVAG